MMNVHPIIYDKYLNDMISMIHDLHFSILDFFFRHPLGPLGSNGPSPGEMQQLLGQLLPSHTWRLFLSHRMHRGSDPRIPSKWRLDRADALIFPPKLDGSM
jgi:hypothetical protein